MTDPEAKPKPVLPIAAAYAELERVKENLRETLRVIDSRPDLNIESEDGKDGFNLSLQNIARQAYIEHPGELVISKSNLVGFLHSGSMGKDRLLALEETMHRLDRDGSLWGLDGNFPSVLRNLPTQEEVAVYYYENADSNDE